MSALIFYILFFAFLRTDAQFGASFLCRQCFSCCPLPRPCRFCCHPPLPRASCCCNCQAPLTAAWTPCSFPCPACHSVARRFCPSVPPPWPPSHCPSVQPPWPPSHCPSVQPPWPPSHCPSVPSPWPPSNCPSVPPPWPPSHCPSVPPPWPPPPAHFPQQQLPPLGYQRIVSSGDLNGIAAASVGEKAVQFPIGPSAEAQQQTQPIIYLIEAGKFLPLANETAVDGALSTQPTAEGPANENGTITEVLKEENATEENVTTTIEEMLNGGPNSSTTTKKVSITAINLIPKVNLRINPNKKITIKTTTERNREKSKVKQFDAGEVESEAQALFDYEESKSGEGPKKIASSKRAVAASKLLEIGMDFFVKRDKLLRRLLLEDRKGNSKRTKRISSGRLDKCDNGLMARIMGRAIVEESSISKRLVKKALKYSFPDSQFDVICAAGGVFSYAIYGKRHCEVKRKGVTCLAFE